VVRKGRYRYVSPELLALWLAAEFWRNQPHRIRQLLDMLTTVPSKESCLERLAALGRVEGVGDVVADLLGKGEFDSLPSLANQTSARLFSVLARGAPLAALETLERTFAGESRDEL